jgi:ketosteroid isomerase-like protein
MSDLKQLEEELNREILSGRALDAFDRFYAEDLVMQENDEEPRVGKAVNRKFEEDFFSSIKEFHGATLGAVAVGDGVTFSEWTFDVTFQDGTRVANPQVTRRQWKDGKVVNERFYYNK